MCRVGAGSDRTNVQLDDITAELTVDKGAKACERLRLGAQFCVRRRVVASVDAGGVDTKHAGDGCPVSATRVINNLGRDPVRSCRVVAGRRVHRRRCVLPLLDRTSGIDGRYGVAEVLCAYIELACLDQPDHPTIEREQGTATVAMIDWGIRLKQVV